MSDVAALIGTWLADAQGGPTPARAVDFDDATDDENVLAWRASADITLALAAEDPATAARIASASIDHILAAMGLEDDFMFLWPPLVLAALAANDTDLAQQLLEPVATAQPGRVAPAVAAQWHRLRGLVAAARGDDPLSVEADLRAGIAALEAFGAVGYRARAQEELAHWLLDQNRPSDAEQLIEQARATYTDIGAAGWLTQLDSRQAERTASRG